MVALIFQIISILVMFIVIGFLITFIVTNYTICFGFQCSQPTSTSFSSSTYRSLKQAFIGCELAASIVYVILAVIYIILFIKCYNKVSKIHRNVRSVSIRTSLGHSALSSLSRSHKKRSISIASSNRINPNERTTTTVSTTIQYNGAEKVCPNCKHVSPYFPESDIIECPKCGYQSNLVEHAQQC